MMSLQFPVILTQPKKQTASPQLDMFRSRLANILDHGHLLHRLSGLIDRDAFEREFGELYSEEGRPGIPNQHDGGPDVPEPRLHRLG